MHMHMHMHMHTHTHTNTNKQTNKQTTNTDHATDGSNYDYNDCLNSTEWCDGYVAEKLIHVHTGAWIALLSYIHVYVYLHSSWPIMYMKEKSMQMYCLKQDSNPCLQSSTLALFQLCNCATEVGELNPRQIETGQCNKHD